MISGTYRLFFPTDRPDGVVVELFQGGFIILLFTNPEYHDETA